MQNPTGVGTTPPPPEGSGVLSIEGSGVLPIVGSREGDPVGTLLGLFEGDWLGDNVGCIKERRDRIV